MPAAPPRGLRVGLLGGSFNPAHEGHIHISKLALDRLHLDQVWWLVSPQNPLKAAEGMAALEDRLESARAVAAVDERIRAGDIERDLGTRYTVDTLAALKKRFSGVQFVWIMGADILVQMPQWKRWRGVFRSVPIAVFARPTYSLDAGSGRAARRFAGARVKPSHAPRLAGARPPAWVFLKTPLNRASATRIRAVAAQDQPK
ncbi:MAG: nicotinate-nucleotide adenylyltransferase [Alphaproteobacteria bacterium]|nr:nicotinate-nucleotide adenylyltransferase [Alphaproteobacteria bacterium]